MEITSPSSSPPPPSLLLLHQKAGVGTKRLIFLLLFVIAVSSYVLLVISKRELLNPLEGKDEEKHPERSPLPSKANTVYLYPGSKNETLQVAHQPPRKKSFAYPPQPPNNCTIVGDDVPRFRIYPLQFMESEQMKEFKPLAAQKVKRFCRLHRYHWHGGTCEIVFFHIFKCGGTSFKSLQPDSLFALGNVTPVLRDATEVQKVQWRQANVTKSVNVFSMLRDPVARFVSAISQIFIYEFPALKKCEASNTTQILFHCVLDLLVKRKFEVNSHLDPQLFFLYQITRGSMDIAVDVLNLSNESAVFQHLGVPVKHDRMATGHTFEQFPQFHLVPSELTPELIQRICKVYHMDVLLLRHVRVLGIDSECFRIPPFSDESK